MEDRSPDYIVDTAVEMRVSLFFLRGRREVTRMWRQIRTRQPGSWHIVHVEIFTNFVRNEFWNMEGYKVMSSDYYGNSNNNINHKPVSRKISTVETFDISCKVCTSYKMLFRSHLSSYLLVCQDVISFKWWQNAFLLYTLLVKTKVKRHLFYKLV